ncbi:MAG: 50S ribosomal protein L31 [Candidatus Buchananbacteria bacterium]|nr:50S ribosomal protein L31 [Candidatus Buchananbacteria bacterium]
MKKDLHPTYYPDATVTCACGNSFTVGSTVEAISVEICSSCHPFYTGKQKLLDTARRVDKFHKRVEAKGVTVRGQGKQAKKAKQQTIKAAKKAVDESEPKKPAKKPVKKATKKS